MLSFSHSVVSDSLQPHGLQPTRLLCPPFSPKVCSDSCPLSWRCYIIISSSASPFSLCLQSFPTSVSFPMNRLISSGGQSIGASASASVFPIYIQGLFPLGLTDLLAVQVNLKSLLHSYNLKASILWHSAFFMVQLSHLYMTTGKILAFTRWPLLAK